MNGEVFVKTRVISAVVGIILLIIVLNFFQTPVLNLAIMVIALIAMHEFLTATKINHNKQCCSVLKPKSYDKPKRETACRLSLP